MKLFNSNEPLYRLLRTIIQGVIGVLIANLDTITGAFILSEVWRAVIVAFVMAVLSPVMAMLGGDDT